MNEFRIKMKKEARYRALQHRQTHTLATLPSLLALVGGCWRLLAIFFHRPSRPVELEIKPKIKGLVVYQPVRNIPCSAPTRATFTGTRLGRKTGARPSPGAATSKPSKSRGFLNPPPHIPALFPAFGFGQPATHSAPGPRLCPSFCRACRHASPQRRPGKHSRYPHPPSADDGQVARSPRPCHTFV
jgi:hypothetical protein